MNSPLISRRGVILAGMASAVAQTAASQPVLTAGNIVARIQKNVGIPWRAETVDKIVAGSPDIPVRGIATTMMATLAVLESAAAEGCNFVITHETPFYLHQDKTSDIADDPTLKYKLNFIEQHGMVIFHFHDHWHARRPDGIAV